MTTTPLPPDAITRLLPSRVSCAGIAPEMQSKQTTATSSRPTHAAGMVLMMLMMMVMMVMVVMLIGVQRPKMQRERRRSSSKRPRIMWVL